MNDPIFKLKKRLRSRLTDFFNKRKYRKECKTKEIIGASFDIIKAHIESQFLLGMTWDNHGNWHIDHIIPLAFAKTEDEAIKLCHYTNLQPLWAIDNLKKGKNMLKK